MNCHVCRLRTSSYGRLCAPCEFPVNAERGASNRYGLSMSKRRIALGLSAVLVVAIAIVAYRYVTRPQVTNADMLTPSDVDFIQTDLNSSTTQRQVLIDFRNPYLADVTRPGSDQPIIQCSTQTYFDASVDHKAVRAMTPLTEPGPRQLACWTSSAPPSPSG